MRTILLMLFSCLVFSCKNPQANNVQVFFDVYEEGKPIGGTIEGLGEEDPAPVDVYLDDVYVGTTPLSLTEDDLVRLNLPLYKRVDTSPTTHWNTWDSDGHGAFEIVDPESSSEKRKLDFRTTDRSNAQIKYFEGLISRRLESGAIGFFPRFTKHNDAE